MASSCSATETHAHVTQLYEFAAKLGAFEGYVYHSDSADPKYLPEWAENLVKLYDALPEKVREEIQPLVDGTAGRALNSLLPTLGEEHEVIKLLRNLIKGQLPRSRDDFKRPS
jgi:hypothetical protein